jgi:putative addiction module killer protein
MTRHIEISFLQLENGKEPFVDWLSSLDQSIQERVLLRFVRIKAGNFGDYKNLGDGVFELKFDFGSGYRVYFGKRGQNLVIILCGGDKSSQGRDIKKAKKYWREL